jgi:branched-chain amino acid aminotransferase
MDGFVAETNACNLFAVSMEGVVLTPTADACLPGVTRGLVIKVGTTVA